MPDLLEGAGSRVASDRQLERAADHAAAPDHSTLRPGPDRRIDRAGGRREERGDRAPGGARRRAARGVVGPTGWAHAMAIKAGQARGVGAESQP